MCTALSCRTPPDTPSASPLFFPTQAKRTPFKPERKFQTAGKFDGTTVNQATYKGEYVQQQGSFKPAAKYRSAGKFYDSTETSSQFVRRNGERVNAVRRQDNLQVAGGRLNASTEAHAQYTEKKQELCPATYLALKKQAAAAAAVGGDSTMRMVDHGRSVPIKRRAVSRERRHSFDYDTTDQRGHEWYTVHVHEHGSARGERTEYSNVSQGPARIA